MVEWGRAGLEMILWIALAFASGFFAGIVTMMLLFPKL
jgi:hypothetical protein